MESKKLFAQTRPVKLFFIASIPGAISMLASALYGLFDGIFVGQFLGSTAFAAVNLAMPFVIINFALSDLIGVGSSVPISISLGQKRDKDACNIFTCAVIMIVGTGILVGTALFGFAPLFIRLMGAEGEFAELAVMYLRVYAVFSPITTIVFAMDNFLRISGYIRYSMSLNVMMSVFCAGIEFLMLGVLGWNIWAAALSNCLCMTLCAAMALIPFLRGKTVLRFVRPRFHMAMIRQIIACGLPSFLNNIAGRITSILLNAILVRLGGETAVSIYGALMYVDGFVQPVMYGACDSLQPAVGYNWGAGKFSRVRALERCCFVAAAVICGAAVAVISLFPSQLVHLFMSDAAGDILATADFAMRLFALTYLTRWVAFATQSYMLAIEKPLQASIISVSTALVFPLLLIAALWPLGLTGIWLNFAGTAALAAVLSIVILVKARPLLNQPDQELPDTGEGAA